MTATFDCEHDELYQIEYWFNVQGPVPNGDFLPIGTCPTARAMELVFSLVWLVCVAAYEQGSCRSSGIKYLPKDEDNSSSSSPGERSRSRRRREPSGSRHHGRWNSVNRLMDEV